jgi:hypothetical protein
MTAVDRYTKKGEGGESNRGAGSKRRRSALLGDPQDVDRAANIVQNTGKNFSTIAAKWGLGYTSAKDTKTNTSAN